MLYKYSNNTLHAWQFFNVWADQKSCLSYCSFNNFIASPSPESFKDYLYHVYNDIMSK